MTHDEFDRYASRTRMKERAIGIARAVLVDGDTIAAAARSAGVSHQTAREAVARIRHEAGYPYDWQTRTVTLPPGDMETVRELEERALREAGLKA